MGIGNVSLRPHKRKTRSLTDAAFNDGTIQEIDMIGTVARWGTNALLVGMAMLTYAIFVLAR